MNGVLMRAEKAMLKCYFLLPSPKAAEWLRCTARKEVFIRRIAVLCKKPYGVPHMNTKQINGCIVLLTAMALAGCGNPADKVAKATVSSNTNASTPATS